MSNNQNPNKEQLLRTIERLERNPDDKVGILADVGITALGVAGAGAAAAFFGTTTASIPIITALTGIGMVVAAPVGLVAGAAVAGGAAVYGISRLIKDGGFNEGKRNQLLHEYREKLREVEAKDKRSEVKEHDITDFYVFLKEPLKLNLLSAEDAYQLIQAVENGQIPLSEAYKLVGQLFDDQSLQDEKIITICPNCSQKLRVPSNLGILTLTCPKCKNSWQWNPR
ncbi:hypothetical protein I8752_07890 [Nostocaceae cyanobacterium CENA369]|uniref:Uncharacterized protein n=1 Tax=Dendronalium phyllosphericum CENA369 TaxID=1725256 RepID=A0A8J7HZ10_9NOST|nr:zinc-ribbon domain-containing protein [Dendronalium phyllosphericum]MBH8572939.1 hypothetical protein [Dendronalium phyllosphericum CENA369]